MACCEACGAEKEDSPHGDRGSSLSEPSEFVNPSSDCGICDFSGDENGSTLIFISGSETRASGPQTKATSYVPVAEGGSQESGASHLPGRWARERSHPHLARSAPLFIIYSSLII